MASAVAKSSRFNVDHVLCEDLQKPRGSILTGIGFLDHMIDQFNSHAQIGVSLVISDFAGEESLDMQDRNRHATHDQAKLLRLVGYRLGNELRSLLQNSTTIGTTSRFCCPLDEALVACELKYNRSTTASGKLVSFSLPPYGKFPLTGRKYVGRLETDKLMFFWESLAEQSGLDICLDKIRGDNAHHIVESSFKAFSRALRNLLDGTNTTQMNTSSNRLEQVYGPGSDNWKATVAMFRQASVKRATKETSISTMIRMDGGKSGSHVDTGIATLDRFFATFASNAAMSLEVNCKGDLWIDEHHTAEDVSIAIGQALNEALATKKGLNRMWSVSAKQGDSHVEVTMDLSNRPCFTHNLRFLENSQEEKAGDLSLEMFEHALDSLVINARMTVHIVEVSESCSSLEDMIQAIASAFGLALKYCAMVDCRRAGATASSKGTLSV